MKTGGAGEVPATVDSNLREAAAPCLPASPVPAPLHLPIIFGLSLTKEMVVSDASDVVDAVDNDSTSEPPT